MKKQFFFLSSLCLVLAACSTNINQGKDQGRNGQTMAPRDQAENEMDRTITQRIRQALMDDDTLSMNAKNIRVITSNGTVTLKGTVNSEREKNEVARKIQSMSGVKGVVNQLEIASSDMGG